jgi:metal-dependent amidase/aminoacylase/carboxypeptidase family protein
LTDKPELAFHEEHAHRVLTTYLARQKGWTVEGWPSMKTAFVATCE